MTTTLLRASAVSLPEIASPREPEAATALPAPPTRTRVDRAAAIVTMRQAGATYEQISQALGEHRAYVHRILRCHGFTRATSRGRRAQRTTEIINRRLAGQSYAEIESALGLRGKSVVHRVLARAGLVGVDLEAEAERRLGTQELDAGRRRLRASRALAERNRRILEMLEAGEPVRSIAELMGVSVTTVYRLSNAAGAIRRHTRDERDRRIVELYTAGERVRSIAEAVGVTPRTVFRVVARCSGSSTDRARVR